MLSIKRVLSKIRGVKPWPAATADRVSLIATVIAAAALMATARACQRSDNAARVAEQSLALSRKTYEQSLEFIWVGTVDGSTLKLTPSNSEVQIQQAWIIFPTDIFSYQLMPGFQELVGPPYSVDLVDLTKKVKSHCANSFIQDGEGSATSTGGLPPSKIPIVIECSYHVKGEFRTHRLVYQLPYHYELLLDSKVKGPAEVQNFRFKNLLCYAKCRPSADSQLVVSSLWSIHTAHSSEEEAERSRYVETNLEGLVATGDNARPTKGNDP